MSIVTEKKGPIYFIKFDNAKRKNAITYKMYDDLIQATENANQDEDTFLTVFTGCGDEFYSSGNDFSPSNMPTEDLHNPNSQIKFRLWVDRLIEHKKVLIALVNGPAIGIACTTLTLMDLVIMSDQAYLLCPFTQFGLCPEGTSSYNFVQIMGRPKAGLLALFAEKMPAQEAYYAGLASRVIPAASFKEETNKLLEKYSKLAKHSILISKAMMHPLENQEKLHNVNAREENKLRGLASIASTQPTDQRILRSITPVRLFDQSSPLNNESS